VDTVESRSVAVGSVAVVDFVAGSVAVVDTDETGDVPVTTAGLAATRLGITVVTTMS